MTMTTVLPTLREKKRYIAFEVISKQPVTDAQKVYEAINSSVHSYIGTKGASEAGIIMLREKYDSRSQRGLVKVSHKAMDNLRASLSLIESINNTKVIVRSMGASGALKKAYTKYIANGG
jgi:ribonuclease P/MRP protein subunit POP5